MATFLVQRCGSQEQDIVSIDGGVIGQIWSYHDPLRPGTFCGILIEETTEEFFLEGLEQYNDCFECLSNIEGALYEFKYCDEESNIFITPSEFGFLPSLGDTFYLTTERAGELTSRCVYLNSVLYNDESTPTTFVSQISFSDCEQCLFLNTPRSGGTTYEECIICCPCDTGTTVNSVSAPHPEWTDGFGIQVTQLNMVVLGGPNGLNS